MNAQRKQELESYLSDIRVNARLVAELWPSEDDESKSGDSAWETSRRILSEANRLSDALECLRVEGE